MPGLIMDRRPPLVIGCDSLLEIDGVGHGKPGTPPEAVRRWQQIRGRAATLHTGHHVILHRGTTVATRTAVASTLVHFAEITDAEIEAYVATTEPLNVAGGFTIDGLGGPFITRIEGDHHNVVGISLPLLRTMLNELGIWWPSLWRVSIARTARLRRRPSAEGLLKERRGQRSSAHLAARNWESPGDIRG